MLNPRTYVVYCTALGVYTMQYYRSRQPSPAFSNELEVQVQLSCTISRGIVSRAASALADMGSTVILPTIKNYERRRPNMQSTPKGERSTNKSHMSATPPPYFQRPLHYWRHCGGRFSGSWSTHRKSVPACRSDSALIDIRHQDLIKGGIIMSLHSSSGSLSLLPAFHPLCSVLYCIVYARVGST